MIHPDNEDWLRQKARDQFRKRNIAVFKRMAVVGAITLLLIIGLVS